MNVGWIVYLYGLNRLALACTINIIFHFIYKLA